MARSLNLCKIVLSVFFSIFFVLYESGEDDRTVKGWRSRLKKLLKDKDIHMSLPKST